MKNVEKIDPLDIEWPLLPEALVFQFPTASVNPVMVISRLTASFFENGAISAPTKSRNPTHCLSRYLDGKKSSLPGVQGIHRNLKQK